MQHPIIPPGTLLVIQPPEHQPEIQPSGSTIPAPEVQPLTTCILQTYIVW